MKLVACTRCGSKELTQERGYVICVYCQSRFAIEPDDVTRAGTTIGLASDIEALLQKCRDDPANRRRYASLILDIDPANEEAVKYLR